MAQAQHRPQHIVVCEHCSLNNCVAEFWLLLPLPACLLLFVLDHSIIDARGVRQVGVDTLPVCLFLERG